jgi:hypothetical protein
MPDPLTIAKVVIDTVIERTIGLTPTGKAKSVAYFYLPLLILGLVAYSSGALSTDSAIAISQLKTEMNGAGVQSVRRGLVVIAEPDSSQYRIPMALNGAKIWSSLDENAARRNKERVGINQDELKVDTPFIGEGNPVALVVDGDVGKEIYAPGETVSIDKWGLSSRRSASLVHGVLFICALALGLGVAVGFPPVNPDEDHRGQEGKKPDENQVIQRHPVNSPARKVRVRPRAKTNRKKVPRIEQHGQ